MSRKATIKCLMDIKKDLSSVVSKQEWSVLEPYIENLAKAVGRGADMSVAAVEHNLLRLRKELYETRRANLDQEVRVEADRVKRSQIADPELRMESFLKDNDRVATSLDVEARRAVEQFKEVWDWMAPNRKMLGVDWLWDIGRRYEDARGRMWARAIAGKPAADTPQFVLDAAAKYKQWIDDAFVQLKDNGVETKKLPYRIPHKWEPALVEANKDRFIALLEKHLSTDPRHHPDPAASAQAIYEGIIKSVGPSDPEFRIRSMREVFFANIDAEIAILEEFGTSSWMEMFQQDMAEMSNKVVLATEYGAKAFDTMQKMADATLKDAKNELIDTKKQAALDKTYGTIKTQIDHLAGRLEGVHNQNVASIAAGLRVGIGAALLQRSSLFSIVDFATTTAYNAEMMHRIVPGLVAPDGSPLVQKNSGMARYISELMANFKRHRDLLGDENFRAVIDSIGTIESISMGQTLDRHSALAPANTPARLSKIGRAQAFEAGAQKFANGVMRIQGSTALMQQSQRSATLALATQLGAHSSFGTTWTDLQKIDPILHSKLEDAGFDADKWNTAVRHGKVVQIRGHTFIVPDDVDVKNRSGLAARRALMTFFQMQSRYMVVQPDFATRAQIASAVNRDWSKAGTVPGELARFGVQFMSYQIAAVRNISVHAYRTKGVAGLGRVGLATMAGAMLVTQIQQWLAGKPMYTPYGRGLAMWSAQSFNTTGMAWLAGSAVQAGVSAGLTGTPLAANEASNFIGPTPETAYKLATDILVNPIKDIAKDGELSDATKRHLILTPGRMVPVANMPFFAHWYNRLLYDFATDVDPKYGRMVDKRDQQLGRELWED